VRGDPVPAGDREDRQSRRLLSAIVAGYAVAYALLAAAGLQIFIFKTMVMPAFLLYALRQRHARRFAIDWLPFLGATLLFDAVRGGIFQLVDAGVRPVFITYAIDLDARLLGTPSASTALQAALRTAALDRAMVLLHGTHFVYFLFVGLLIWQARRPRFWQYRRVMLGVMAGGLAGYLVIPTAPPWLAAADGFLPAVAHITAGTYASMPELHAAFDTNPVAAMPSLHAAFPVACAVLIWRLFGRRAGALAIVYAVATGVAAVYLGEHYVVDLLAGAALAAAACAAIGWPHIPRADDRLARPVLVSALLALLSGAIVLGSS
jgi:membrane-associated phospholipid phosphatase